MKSSFRSRRLAARLGVAGLLGCGAAWVIAGANAPATVPPIPNTANRVTSFAQDHPEFAPLRDNRSDATPLAFSHKTHLGKAWTKEQSEAKAGRVITCGDCHVPDPDRRLMLPVTFDANCRACHSAALGTLDVAPGVLPARQAPHGSPAQIGQIVEQLIRQWYATASFEPRPAASETDKPAENEAGSGRRRGRGSSEPAPPAKAALPAFKSAQELDAFIVKAQVDTYKSEMSRCGFCHSVEKSPDADKGDSFSILRPNIPASWLPRAIFHHGTHQSVECLECHGSAVNSQSSTDINLAGIDTCRKCHSPRGNAGDTCVTCHVYHDRSRMGDSGRMTIANLLDPQHAAAHARDSGHGGTLSPTGPSTPAPASKPIPDQ